MTDLQTWSDLNKGVREVKLLSQHILDLQKDKGKLTDRVRELEQQIERMKCCQNCSHLCSRCELGIDGCYVCSKWELRGIDK